MQKPAAKTSQSKSNPRKFQSRSRRKRSSSQTSQILTLLAREPLDHGRLAEKLRLGTEESRQLKEVLRNLESQGKIARIRRDRYVIPEEADLVTGEIQFHASGSAHVLSGKPGEPDLFIGAENASTAMHGDKVVARIHSRESGADWRPGLSQRSKKREGRVIRILERANDRIVGTLQRSKNFFYVVADDPRFVQNLYVPEPLPPLSAKVGDKVVARLEVWESRHVNPEGSIVEVLGPASQPGVDMLSIIRKHRLPEEFPKEVLREAERAADEQIAGNPDFREDHRQSFVFTVDPDDARDFDDAISVEKTATGWSVAVHIADVSHYVRPKSALDREAYARGNSVYLPDRVIPMLPEALSNGACSLRPGEDRLAFSVFAKIGTNGNVRSTHFAKTIIRSRKRLTYREALAILEQPPQDELGHHVHTAWELSSLLRRLRFANGSLELDFPETKVVVDDLGKPIRIDKLENDISHQLIEELMLLANESVARELQRHKQPVVYRVHEQPEEERLADFRELALSYGAHCGDLGNRSELQKLLHGVRGLPHEYAVKLGLLKSLKRARYCEEPLGHYGLAKSQYLHFTSPIRRYADLVAHRALERRLQLSKQGPDASHMPAVAEHISTTERVAADAEKEAVKLKKLEYFQAQISANSGITFLARVVEVRNFGIFVELPDYLLSGLIHVSALEEDFFVFDPVRSRMQGRRTKKIYEVGQELRVEVSRVDVFKQQVDFRPVSEKGRTLKAPSSRRKRK